MVIWEDSIFRVATFKSLKQEGLSDEDALMKLRKIFPIYGDPLDESNMQGDNRPLPNEMHDSINQIANESTQITIQKSLMNFRSMNAFIRDMLK